MPCLFEHACRDSITYLLYMILSALVQNNMRCVCCANQTECVCVFILIVALFNRLILIQNHAEGYKVDRLFSLFPF